MIETINDPNNAPRNPSTLNPSINEAANIKSDALIMNINSPSVSMVIGRVRITKIGLTITLRTPSINAAISAGYIPSTSMPGINWAVISNAKAVTKILDIIFIYVTYYQKKSPEVSG